MKYHYRCPIGPLSLAAAAMLFMAGCNKNSTGPGSATVSSNQDAAQSIANAVGEDNGGVADQMGDIADATGSSGISANVGSAWTDGPLMKGTVTSGDTVVKTFNASDTSWTVAVVRTRVGLYGREAGFTRTYNIKFIDRNGVALDRYITTQPADTASTILFKVLNGTGYTITRFVSTHLLSISSSFVVTGVNTSTITVNGTLTRTGTDTIKTLTGERVLNHSLTLNLQNVTGPRTPRYATVSRIPRATGGTITGTYSATVSVVRGDSYTERSFTKTFTITFSQTAGTIDVGGTSYTFDTEVGELN
ncbi:MAG TPA: hypothetical protein VI758_10405 [Bacteroidota bacterium]